MDIATLRRGARLTVSLSGELDHHCAAETRAALEALLRDPEITVLCLDMGKVSFMDSSGLGVILGRYRTMSARGGKLTIACAGKYVDRILRMSGIYSLCPEERHMEESI